MSRETFAYGHPDFGGVVAGGLNSGSYSLMGWTIDEDATTRTIRATIAFHSESALEGGISALQRASGNLGITVGSSSKSIVCTSSSPSALGNGTQEITVTRSSGGTFSAADVGLPVNITSGPAAQVLAVTSSTVAIIGVAIGQPWTLPSDPITITFGTELVRCAHRQRSTTGDLFAGGIAGRPTVTRPGSADDDRDRRIVEFSCVFQRPAKESRGDDSDRPHVRASSVSRSTTESGLIAITFSGQVTAGVVSGTATDAVGILSTAIDTWIANQLSDLASGLTMELVGNLDDTWDDERSVLSFSRSYRQLNFPDLEGTTNDPRITGASVRMARVYRNVHGIKNARTPFNVAVSYSASITATGANATTYDNIPALWASTIKPFLVGRVKALFGGTPVVLSGGDPDIDPVTSRITASMMVFVAGSGSTVYSYSRVTEMALDENVELDRLWDGQDHTYVEWTGAGRSLFGTVTVNVVNVGSASKVGNQPSSGGGIFFSGGGLSLTIPSAGIFGIGASISNGNSGSSASPSKVEYFPNPGTPAEFFGSFAPSDGSWRVLRRRSVKSPTYWGQDPDNAGNTIEITSWTTQASYVYKRGSSLTDPALPRPSTGSSGGSKIESRARQVGKSPPGGSA